MLAGENFDGKIRHALEEADVIVFMVSTASLASKYIQEVELSRALNRMRTAILLPPPKVIPILLEKDCAWKGEVPGRDRKLDHLQILPGDRRGNIKAVDQWPSRRKAFNAVEQALRRLLS